MTDLLERRLLVVTGKGGVGKTTVAIALALAAAARGRRTVLCELTPRPRAPRMLGVREGDGSGAVALGPNLWTISIDPQRALEEWLARTIGRPGAHLLSRSSTFGYFVAAAPGARELVTLGKAWDLAQPGRRGPAPYELVVLDTPATGHAVALLGAPRTFARLAPDGPVARQAGRIRDSLASPDQTGVLGVTLPTEMSVSETLELDTRLEQEIGRSFEAVVVNQVFPRRFTEDEVRRVHDVLSPGRHPGLRVADRATRSAYVRRSAQDVQLTRLRAALTVGLLEVPFVFRTALGPEDLRSIGARLESELHPS